MRYISGADASAGAGAAPPRIFDQLYEIYISGADAGAGIGVSPPKIVDQPHKIYISSRR